MKKIFYSCFLFTFIFSSSLKAQNEKILIERKAESQLLQTLSIIPIGSEKKYGFDKREDFQKCKIGKPIKVLTIDKINMKDSLVEINEWRIPVILNDQNITLITAQKINDDFEIVDIGGQLLAKELQGIKTNATENQYLLRLYNLHIDFITSSKRTLDTNTVEFIPLNSAKKFLNINQKKDVETHYSLNDIIELNKLNLK